MTMTNIGSQSLPLKKRARVRVRAQCQLFL